MCKLSPSPVQKESAWASAAMFVLIVFIFMLSYYDINRIKERGQLNEARCHNELVQANTATDSLEVIRRYPNCKWWDERNHLVRPNH